MIPFHADRGAVFADEERFAVEEVGVGAAGEFADDEGEFAGEVILVGVEPTDQVARGAAEAFVDGVRLAAVRFGDEGKGITGGDGGRQGRRLGRPLFQEGDRTIGGAAVDYEVLDFQRHAAGVGRGFRSRDLREDAFERFSKKAPVVEVRRDDGNFHGGES